MVIILKGPFNLFTGRMLSNIATECIFKGRKKKHCGFSREKIKLVWIGVNHLFI